MYYSIFNQFDSILADERRSALHSDLDPNYAQNTHISLSSLQEIINPDKKTFDKYVDKLEKPEEAFAGPGDPYDGNPAFEEYFDNLKIDVQAAERLRSYYAWYSQYVGKGKDYELNFILWVDENDIPACYLVLCNFTSGTNEIEMLEVLPHCKGTGLGSQIFRYAVQHFDINRLDVYPDNKVALNMYKKNGFGITVESKRAYDAGETDKYVMVRIFKKK